ncbi:MAG: hypothetical protein ACI9H6_000181 [Patiriisocius sp.]|jgi:hypothetical protein
MSGSQKRISGAVLASAALIAVTLFITTEKQATQQSAENVAVVTVVPERKAIATADKNQDGVPDWQEALVVTEALSLEETLPSAEYITPETLTEQFALEFFQDVVRAENYGAFGATNEEILANAGDQFGSEALDTLLNASDITVSSDTSVLALSHYGEEVAAITARYPSNNAGNEAVILETALREQNEASLEALDSRIVAYTGILTDTQALPVPASMQKEHLDLLNSYQAILSDITAMRQAFSDPMLALLRMKRYEDDTLGLTVSIINVYTKLIADGAVWDQDSVVFTLIGVGEPT